MKVFHRLRVILGCLCVPGNSSFHWKLCILHTEVYPSITYSASLLIGKPDMVPFWAQKRCKTEVKRRKSPLTVDKLMFTASCKLSEGLKMKLVSFWVRKVYWVVRVLLHCNVWWSNSLLTAGSCSSRWKDLIPASTPEKCCVSGIQDWCRTVTATFATVNTAGY